MTDLFIFLKKILESVVLLGTDDTLERTIHTPKSSLIEDLIKSLITF